MSEIEDIKDIEEIEKVYKEAEKEYFEFLDTCDIEARKWKSEDDMYGWNFHQGMRSGAVWANLMYDRIRRKLEEIKKNKE